MRARCHVWKIHHTSGGICKRLQWGERGWALEHWWFNPLSTQITSSDSHGKQNTLCASKEVWCSLLADMAKIGKIRRASSQESLQRTEQSTNKQAWRWFRGNMTENYLCMKAEYNDRAQSPSLGREKWLPWGAEFIRHGIGDCTFLTSWHFLLLCYLALAFCLKWTLKSDPQGVRSPTDLNLAFIYHTPLKAKQSETQRLNWKSLKIRHNRVKLCCPRQD